MGPLTSVVRLADVVAAARNTASTSPTRLIGVDGPSGAGKSLLARRLLAHADDAALVRVDDFVSWNDFSGWWPRFDAEVLTPLLGAQTPATGSATGTTTGSARP